MEMVWLGFSAPMNEPRHGHEVKATAARGISCCPITPAARARDYSHALMLKSTGEGHVEPTVVIAAR